MKKEKPANYYLVGIKGVAMTALAVYLKQSGNNVEGSDVEEVFSTDAILHANGIKIRSGFKPENINNNINILIATGAHGGGTNIEVKTAKKLNIKTYMHGAYLGFLMSEKFGIAVAGCHGKTTTSSMIAKVISMANFNPSYLIGTAYIKGLGPAGHFGIGKYLVAEADEYMTCPTTDRTPRFLHLHPEIAVITNIDYDHPDEFETLDAVKAAYLKFVSGISKKGLLVLCADDPGIKSILPKLKNSRIITYGFDKLSDYRILKDYFNNNALAVEINAKNGLKMKLSVRIPGKHNLLNALAAAIVCHEIGIPWNKIENYINKFEGSNRRFELVKNFNKSALYDDYAHHPSEISATITAIKEWFPDRKLIIIFQPHTFSRTKMFLKDFAQAFVSADNVFVADIFPSAREKIDSSINSSILVSHINAISKNAKYIKNIKDLLVYLNAVENKNRVIVTMGAGNLNNWHAKIIENLSKYD